MKAGQLFRIARRYSITWRQGYLSGFLSLLSVLGLVLAIALLILVLSVMNGFDREMRENILALVPHLAATAGLGGPGPRGRRSSRGAVGGALRGAAGHAGAR